MEFLRHAGSIADHDVAAFAFALHELMGRQGLLLGGQHEPSSLNDEELWGNVAAGLKWLQRLHELAPKSGPPAARMQNRLDPTDPERIKRDLESARNRAKWCGGMPLWLVLANLAVLGFVATVATVLLVSEPRVVQASDSPGPAALERILELEALTQEQKERSDFQQTNFLRALERMRERLDQLEDSK